MYYQTEYILITENRNVNILQILRTLYLHKFTNNTFKFKTVVTTEEILIVDAPLEPNAFMYSNPGFRA